MSEVVIGINIEDNHISAGLIDIEDRKILGNIQRKRVDPLATAEQIIIMWRRALQDFSGKSTKVGIGAPDFWDYNSGSYINPNSNRYRNLLDKNVKQIFAEILAVNTDDIKLVNDAACFLQGEVFAGAGKGFNSSLGITLGAGLGSSTYSRGVVKDACLYKAPFKDAIAEDYISVRWLLKRFEEVSGVQATEISALKEQAGYDHKVAQIFKEFAANLSEFLVTYIKRYNPEIVVIGGYLELYNRFFFDVVVDNVKAAGLKTPVLRATLGEKGSILGAASCWHTTELHKA